MTEEVSPLEMLAVEHGAWFDEDGDIGMTAENLDAFVQAAIKQEREACAKECDEMPQRLGIHCARAIRARSEDREGSGQVDG